MAAKRQLEMLKRLERLGEQKARAIDKIIKDLDKTVSNMQPRLFNDVVVGVLDKFELDSSGMVLNTTKNFEVLNKMNNTFTTFINDQGGVLSQQLYDSFKKTITSNLPYFEVMTTDKAKLLKTDKRLKVFLNNYLGITKGSPVENGYLNKIVTMENVTRKIQDYMANSIITQKGFFEIKAGLSDLIEGSDSKNGALKQYYRNFVYDSVAQVDRVAANVYREDLELVFAVYAGGLIKTTRTFCREHNDKVYHITEIEEFKPKSAIPTDGTYNPLTMMAGYNCRHYYNWITEAMALALRPDAIKFIN